jgi:uncharacterized protein (DUF433 family)
MSSEKDPRHYSSGMMASVPVIRGTRVPLWDLIGYLQDGRGLEAFLADHPQVTAAQATRTIVDGLQALAERREKVPELGRGRAGGAKPPPRSAGEGDPGKR